MGFSKILVLISVVQVIGMLKSPCDSKDNCGDCISYAHERCVWCSANEHSGKRCASVNVSKVWCKENVYPTEKLENIQYVEDKPITLNVNGKKNIQLKPQRIKFKGRPGEEILFKMSYKPVDDYPLDIYYLMDNSFTMIAHKNELRKQGEKIPTRLSNVTNNVRLGVGTFVEKPALPFAKWDNHAYSYQNHLSLTTDMTLFKRTVDNITNASNLDDPEAGFDALMQVMVCGKEIGWREEAWKIIVLCTDNTYHSAGDGKKVGAFTPNDMKCHLENGSYTEALRLDYPSVSQINKIATDLKFSIIFAATKNVESVYKILAKKVKWSRYAELKHKSNIVEIIEEEYRNLSKNLHLDVNVPGNVQITLSPNCMEINNLNCGIKYKELKEVTVKLKLKSCSIENKRIEINGIGSNDKLEIEIETICKCPCEDSKNTIFNSSLCSSNGTLECGLCKCNENRYGEKCGCVISSADDRKSIDKCKVNQNDTDACSGRGVCRCGQCIQCNEGFSGPFCEYDDTACFRSNGELCAHHGNCTLGRCHCYEHWTGPDCSCPDHNKDCIAPHSSQVCSGNGLCECGHCVCNKKLDDKNETYSGIYCDYCEACVEKRCRELNEYIAKSCFNHLNKVVCNVSGEIDIEMLSKSALKSYNNAKWCSSALENGCSIIYKYKYDTSNKMLQLIVQTEEDCPPKAIIWIPVGAAIGSIVLIGLLTAVVWKILVDMHDAREYEKFYEESKAAGWNVSLNPLYKPPDTTFTNPVFLPSK